MTEGASPIHLLPSFGHCVLSKEDAEHYRRTQGLPVKVLQFGEGNFLRGFADWMLDRCNRQGLFNGSVAVTQPRPSGKNNLDKFRKQDGLYTLLIRGLKEGVQVEEKETVAVVTRTVDPYEEWDQFVALADHPNLEWILSNTTEAGLCYTPCAWTPDEPILSFPAKLTIFLYRRFVSFSGDPAKGLIHLPCELLDRNGERLRDIVLHHAEDWMLSLEFREWIVCCNRLLNTLVDRIVTGYPAEADEYF